MTNDTNITQLLTLVAGLGRGGARHLHIRDEDHGNALDYHIMTSAHMRQALLAGNFDVLATEAFLTASQVETVEGRDGAIEIINPDRRFEFIANLIRQTPGTGEADSRAFLESPQTYYDLWYRHRVNDFENAREVAAFAQQNNIALPSGGAERLLRIVDLIERGSISTQANRQVINTLDRERDPARENTVYLWGNWHTMFEDDGTPDNQNIDMDSVYPGPVISIVQNRAEMNANIALARNDDAEFYFIASEGVIVDRRPAGAQPSLESIQAAGLAALTPAAGPEPAPLPVDTTHEGAGDEGTGDEANDDENDDNAPWWNMIGAAIGAWLTSQMGGGGIGGMFAMIIGGLFGWVLGGAMGGNHGNPFGGLMAMFNNNGERESTDDTVAEQTVETPTPAPATALHSLTPVAFAQVNSITASLPVRDTSNTEALDGAAPTFPIALVSDAPMLANGFN